MPVVWVPGLLQDLTGGQDRIVAPGETVGQLIEALEARYPGLKARLLEDGRLRPGIAVVVDGEVSARRLRHRLAETSEIHFLPAISGG